jgi:hypothetical protein
MKKANREEVKYENLDQFLGIERDQNVVQIKQHQVSGVGCGSNKVCAKV